MSNGATPIAYVRKLTQSAGQVFHGNGIVHPHEQSPTLAFCIAFVPASSSYDLGSVENGQQGFQFIESS
ncbi:hypothetical protein G9P44_004951 [Scheffersomyces stipitis]|nr:hypothetical protein G9P44_004951 [Scheffersomyces stipitis]